MAATLKRRIRLTANSSLIMISFTWRKPLNLLLALLLACSISAHAADILLVNNDSANEGFNDPSPAVSNQTGNTGNTLGEQRLRVFEAAANYWEQRLVIDVDVLVGINFDPLSCSAFSATLGSAGATNIFRNFTNAPRANTWYVSAVANNLAGRRVGGNSVDIQARFNSAIDNNSDCLRNTNWWLGINSPAPAGTISLFDTVLHEIGHGLGVSSGIRQNGELLAGFIDAYAFYLYDETRGQFWRDMTVAQRVTSATNTGNVTFRGPSVMANTGHIDEGKRNGNLRVYAPSPYRSGSSISHWDTALVPDELMEPSATPTSDDRATLQMLRDVGWRLLGNQNSNPGSLGLESSNISVDEDQGTVQVQLRRTGGSDGIVSVNVNTTNGSATAGSDYQAINNQTVSWANNESGIKTVPLTLFSDDDVESNETFSITLSGATGGSNISSSSATVTINDTTVPPVPGSIGFVSNSLSIDEDDGRVQIQLRRTGGSDGVVSVRVNSVNGLAVAGDDYQRINSQTISWGDGQSGIRNLNFTVLADEVLEGDEDLSLVLSGVTGGASLGVASTTIVIKDKTAVAPAPGSVGFAVSALQADEDQGTVDIQLRRLNGITGEVSVRVNTVNDSAIAGEDFQAIINQTVSWPDGDNQVRRISLTLLPDELAEGNETLSVTLSNPTGGASINQGSLTVTIIDADSLSDTDDELDLAALMAAILSAIRNRNK